MTQSPEMRRAVHAKCKGNKIYKALLASRDNKHFLCTHQHCPPLPPTPLFFEKKEKKGKRIEWPESFSLSCSSCITFIPISTHPTSITFFTTIIHTHPNHRTTSPFHRKYVALFRTTTTRTRGRHSRDSSTQQEQDCSNSNTPR